MSAYFLNNIVYVFVNISSSLSWCYKSMLVYDVLNPPEKILRILILKI